MRSVLIVLAVLAGCGGDSRRTWHCNGDGVCWAAWRDCEKSKRGACAEQEQVSCLRGAAIVACYATSAQCKNIARSLLEVGNDVDGCVAR